MIILRIQPDGEMVPKPAVDAVALGTTLLRSIYENARAQGYNGPESDFSSPGTRPLRRETGILLLADSVEAATRALKDPTTEMVAARARQVIQMRVSENELDDCRLTLKDMAEIQETFTRTLTLGVYHNRIDYPSALNPNRLPSGGLGKNGTNPDADEDNRIHSLPGVVDRPA